jgi:hypothetical protein
MSTTTTLRISSVLVQRCSDAEIEGMVTNPQKEGKEK